MITFSRLLEQVNNTEKLLNEGLAFYQYKALVRITYSDNPDLNLGAEKIAELLRSVPGATRVSTASLDKKHHVGIFNVRIISQKKPKECFVAFKRNTLDRFGESILKVEVGNGTIEKKGFIR